MIKISNNFSHKIFYNKSREKSKKREDFNLMKVNSNNLKYFFIIFILLLTPNK